MTGQGTLRLLAFRPQADAADDALRQSVVPALLDRPGLVDIFLARHGAEWDDERVIVTVWDEHASTPERLEEELLAGAGIEVGDLSRLDVLPVRIALRHPGRQAPSVLRVFRGTVRSGAWDTYLEAAQSGALFDGATNLGAIALYLAAECAPDFVTVSAWVDWPSIEAATGGDIRRPFATRNQELLERVHAAHYEILPNVARPAHLGWAGIPA